MSRRLWGRMMARLGAGFVGGRLVGRVAVPGMHTGLHTTLRTGVRRSVRVLILAGVLHLTLFAPWPAGAQQPSVAELIRRIDTLQRRVDELEGGRRGEATAPATPAPGAPPPTAVTETTPPVATPPGSPAPIPADGIIPFDQQVASTVPGLLPPEAMGAQRGTEDALRSDLPGVAMRIPGTDSQVRLYGFAKVSTWWDVNARNQTGAPLPSQIPLTDSAAWEQGGDFGITPQFSRFGLDTRSLTRWGTLETRTEGDFAGGSGTNLQFRLRQAWGELGTQRFRVLVGQANSLWNEGLFETLMDSTNLNQSFTRQAQFRLTGRLAENLEGQFSIEAPETSYTSAAGVFTPNSRFDGGASPAFDTMPDFLARLNYNKNGLSVVGRGMIRRLSLRSEGTAADPPAVTRNAVGWGLAEHVHFPMRWINDAFGPDEVIAMGFYGQGIGRYFPASTIGLDAVSNIGLPDVNAGAVTLDTIPTYGAVAAYRRWWTTPLRSNFSFAYTRSDFQDYTLGFIPGSASATALNRDQYQVFGNLIWSPFAAVRNDVFGSGWIDVGVEYVFTRRDIFGGTEQTGTAGLGHGTANRFLGAAVVRY